MGWVGRTVVVALALALATPVSAAGAAGESTYVLEHLGPDTVDLGSEVTEILTATDGDGLPIPGLSVRFVRTGPGSETAESCSVQDLTLCAVTSGAGEALHSFGVGLDQGVIEVRAEIYTPDGVLVAEAGPDRITAVFTCSFRHAKCTPLPRPSIAGSNKHGRDVLRVEARAFRGGTSVVLMRKNPDGWRAVGRGKTLNRDGRCAFSVRDRNGDRRTRYRAAILPSDPSAAAVTPVTRLR